MKELGQRAMEAFHREGLCDATRLFRVLFCLWLIVFYLWRVPHLEELYCRPFFRSPMVWVRLLDSPLPSLLFVRCAVGVLLVAALFAVSGGLAAVAGLSSARIDQRVQEAIAKAEGYGIDLSDLYYDFDVPGDQYPFGDGEDWMPNSWKPPKTGDMKYLPTKMLGQIQIRTNQYEAIKQCEAKGIDIGDLCVPFEDYEGEFDTNAKRLIEMRRRLDAAR